MTYAILLAVLEALLPVKDWHGRPIRRPYNAAEVIAKVAMETDSPLETAIMLDVLAAHESAYRITAVGDSGKSCGAWQTPCDSTPKDAMGQARRAVGVLKQATENCPDHPIWAYASGRCMRTDIADRYEREISVRTQYALAAQSTGTSSQALLSE